MRSRQSGFTLVELLVVLSLLALMSVFSVEVIQNYSKQQTLRMAETELRSWFRETRQKTLASETTTSFGVHVATSSVVRYGGAAYDPNDPTNEVVSFSGIAFTPALSDGSSGVQFARLTGAPSATGTITILQQQTGEMVELRVTEMGLLERE